MKSRDAKFEEFFKNRKVKNYWTAKNKEDLFEHSKKSVQTAATIFSSSLSEQLELERLIEIIKIHATNSIFIKHLSELRSQDTLKKIEGKFFDQLLLHAIKNGYDNLFSVLLKLPEFTRNKILVGDAEKDNPIILAWAWEAFKKEKEKNDPERKHILLKRQNIVISLIEAKASTKGIEKEEDKKELKKLYENLRIAEIDTVTKMPGDHLGLIKEYEASDQLKIEQNENNPSIMEMRGFFERYNSELAWDKLSLPQAGYENIDRGMDYINSGGGFRSSQTNGTFEIYYQGLPMPRIFSEEKIYQFYREEFERIKNLVNVSDTSLEEAKSSSKAPTTSALATYSVLATPPSISSTSSVSSVSSISSVPTSSDNIFYILSIMEDSKNKSPSARYEKLLDIAKIDSSFDGLLGQLKTAHKKDPDWSSPTTKKLLLNTWDSIENRAKLKKEELEKMNPKPKPSSSHT